MSPVLLGHDEQARLTVVLGWTITGRIVISYRSCGDAECIADAQQYAAENSVG